MIAQRRGSLRPREVAVRSERFEHDWRDGLVGRPALRQNDADRHAGLVNRGVDLGARSSTGTTDDDIRPLFPAGRVLGSANDGRIDQLQRLRRLSCGATDMRTLVPAAKGLNTVLYGPSRSNRSRLSVPVRNIKKIPLRPCDRPATGGRSFCPPLRATEGNNDDPTSVRSNVTSRPPFGSLESLRMVTGKRSECRT